MWSPWWDSYKNSDGYSCRYFDWDRITSSDSYEDTDSYWDSDKNVDEYPDPDTDTNSDVVTYVNSCRNICYPDSDTCRWRSLCNSR